MNDLGNLVLTRFRDESIIINGNIEVTVVEVLGGKVRLAVRAPKHISVHRREVHDAIQARERNGEM